MEISTQGFKENVFKWSLPTSHSQVWHVYKPIEQLNGTNSQYFLVYFFVEFLEQDYDVIECEQNKKTSKNTQVG